MAIDLPKVEYWESHLAMGLCHASKIWHIYRKLSSGKWQSIGRIKWDCNYIYIPIKTKYYKLVFLSDRDRDRG